jgi:hypothetical protein
MGGVLDSFLDILYYNPPPTVYHPVLGIGEYYSSANYRECETEKPIATDLKMEH